MTDRIHVLLVVRHLVGGIRTYLKYVFPLLSEQRYKLSMVAMESPESHLLAEDLRPHDVALHLLPPSDSLSRFVPAVRRRVQLARPDVVHAHGFTSGMAAALALIGMRVPLMVTSHGVLSAPDVEGARGRFMQLALGVLLSRCDVLQSVSHDAEANLREFVPMLRRASHLVVIPNGIDTAAFASIRRETLQIRTNTFVFVGRLMPEKGFADLIDAVELLKSRQQEITIEVAGDGGFIREYRADIARRGMEQQFRFLGFVRDISPLLQHVQAQVVPSRFEACPLAPMEALVAGCPLVASDCIGLREVTAGSPTRVFRSGDARALAECLWLARQDAALSAAARAYVPVAQERFDVGRTARSLDRVLTDLAAKARGRAHVVRRVA